ncbi:MAG: tubulin-like doman-containing protein [Acidobacteriota bacterium]|nr:tubulin-like doman-containing protein [Acidobacteriota bacterium]
MAMQALVMGFGGTGAHVLTALKELAVLKYGKMPDSIKFLLFDTIADWEPGKAVQIMGGAAEEKIAKGKERATSLDKHTEYFQLIDHEPDLKKYVFKHLSRAGEPEKYPHLKDWLHAPWLSEHIKENRLNITEGAAQQRQIGRFAMFQNSDKIIERLRTFIRDLARGAGGAAVNVWIIGSSAGGTGAGCLIDAAYMARLAAGDFDINLTGAIILPEVYEGVAGVSKARAYSLLREINRVQEQGIPERDRYIEQGTVVSSRVFYDAHRQQNALMLGKLFSDLFYLGKVCPNGNARESFFTSVANAIDPYLDTSSGPVLLQASVNESAVASSFGAARFYVPVETLADLFAWEQVNTYLKRATAPREEGNLIVNLHYGSDDDRRSRGRVKVENLLKLFEELLQRADKTDNRAWVQNSLDPEKIVTGWYQFAASSLAEDRLTPAEAQTVMLSYIDPFRSFTAPENVKVEPHELETKTYNENKAARGVRESQEESRDRFAKRLEDLTAHYTSHNGGERTFEKGRRLVKEKVKARLRKKVDSIVVDELKQNPGFASDPGREGDGTPLTRLYQEINSIITGPLQQIDAVIGAFIGTLGEEEARRTQQPVNALKDLRDSRKTGFFGTWVESYQQTARQELSEYIRWYQKRELLEDMQELVRDVRQRFEWWRRTLGDVFDILAMHGTESALVKIRREKIMALQDRLYRAANNHTSMISLKEKDPEMDGYVEVLRQQAVRAGADDTLADRLLADSRWEAEAHADGSASLRLVINNFGTGGGYLAEEMTNLPQNLHDYFHQEIRQRLQSTDIFDYLLYLRQRGSSLDDIANTLHARAETLIKAKPGKEEVRLVYKEPSGANKKDIADLILGKLRDLDSGTKDPERSHSDASSLTLLKVKKPNLAEIDNINDCEAEYKGKLSEELSKEPGQAEALYRAQVYHPFRAELEAWYIERHHWKQEGKPANRLMPARIVRLLENPEMMQAFVQALAAGAIEKVKNDWVWHYQQRDVMLTDFDRDGGDADLFSAAVVFALQQREVGRTLTLNAPDAKQSIASAAEKRGAEVEDLLKDFAQTKLESFIAENFAKLAGEERDALKTVFAFYCHPSRKTGLQHRMALNPTS